MAQGGIGYAANGLMDGFLQGYKTFHKDKDDQEYKKLRNAIAKQRLDPTNLKLQQDLLRARTDYMRERGARGPQDRQARDDLARERMKGMQLDNEYRAFRNKGLGQTAPSRVDDVVPGTSQTPESAIPPGPGATSQLDQDQDNEQDANEDVAGAEPEAEPQQDPQQEPVQSAARGGMIRAIPPRAGNRYAEGGRVAPNNFDAAHRALNMTPQEQALYQRHLTNLNGPGGVDNPDGSRSSLYQAVQEHNGKFHNIPTVWNGKRETEPYTRADGTKMDVPNATALANVEKEGWDKFPAYATPDEADSRYDDMHKFMDKDTEAYQNSKNYAEGGDVEDDDTEEEEPDDEASEGESSPEEDDARQTSMLAAHDAARDGILHSVAQNNVGGYGLAVPGPNQAASNRNHLVGAGAFTPAEMDAVRKKVDPTGKMEESDRNMAALSAVHTYWLKQGNPKAAQEMASSMVGYFRKEFDRNKALASAAAEHGDLDAAISYAKKSYANLPDGNRLDVKRNDDGNYSYSLVDGRTNKPVFKPETVTPEVMLKHIQDSADATFDGLMASSASKRAGTLKGASGAYKSAIVKGPDEQLTPEELQGMSPAEHEHVMKTRKEAMGKPDKAPPEPKQSDYHNAYAGVDSALKDTVTDKEGKTVPEFPLPDEMTQPHREAFKSVATDIAARNRTVPGDAIMATAELWDGEAKFDANAGGGGTFKLKNGQTYSVGKNAALQLYQVIGQNKEAKHKAASDTNDKEATRYNAEQEAIKARAELEATRKPAAVAINPYAGAARNRAMPPVAPPTRSGMAIPTRPTYPPTRGMQ